MTIQAQTGSASARAQVRGVRILMRTHLWLWWAAIAIDQEKLAKEARDRALALTPQGEGFGLALSAETRASLISVTACASALDAFHGVVNEYVPGSRATKQPFRILETLKTGFDVGPAGGGAWARELKWLYDLRDPAQHFTEADKPSVAHPTGTHTSLENVLYSLESATRAVDFLLEVLTTCQRNPRPPLEPWAQGGVDRVIADLVSRRTTP